MELTTAAENSTDDDQKGHDYSKCDEEKSLSDDYEFEYDGSDTAVSSGLDDDDDDLEVALHGFKLAAPNVTILEEDESIDTTWTDDKHSSYLDSMEATFVRRMYDKEYCSIDVCGHSSHSSFSVEQDCVESHPLYINVRKVDEKASERLSLRALTGPWSSISSVFISPWFQHFISKQALVVKSSRDPNNPNMTKQSPQVRSKKRDTCSDVCEHRPSLESSHGTGGGFKKLKHQQALSHMDMMMEEQYNAEQKIQASNPQDLGKSPSGKIPELTQQEDGCIEAKDPKNATQERGDPELSLLKEDQSEAWTDLAKGKSMLGEELMSEKSDQLVPSYTEDATETTGQNEVLDATLSSKQGQGKVVEEDKPLPVSEHGKASTGQFGSKTWTWDMQGRRYQLGQRMVCANFKS